MSEFLTFLYCAATGFVVAGVIASFYQLVTLQAADFLVTQKSVAGHLIAVLLSMFAGPVILAGKVVTGLQSRTIAVLPAFVGFMVVGMWSVLAGLFYLSVVLSV